MVISTFHSWKSNLRSAQFSSVIVNIERQLQSSECIFLSICFVPGAHSTLELNLGTKQIDKNMQITKTCIDYTNEMQKWCGVKSHDNSLEVAKCTFPRLHIATHTLSSPITSETVSKKFPRNFQKFPKKLEALLLVAQLGTGNFYRF